LGDESKPSSKIDLFNSLFLRTMERFFISIYFLLYVEWEFLLDIKPRTLPVIQIAVHPPSTMIVAPVMYEAASEARNSTTDAISSGLPKRFRGVLLE